MRLAALDISKRRIGIAISCPQELSSVYEETISPPFVIKLKQMYTKYTPEKTLVGLPFEEEVGMRSNANFIKMCAHNLREIISPFEFVDESFTTCLARQITPKNLCKRGFKIDQVAARILLFRYWKREHEIFC